MRTSTAGVDLIARFEGLRLKAYKPVPSEQFWTIGYGHYGPNVKASEIITESEARQLLRADLHEAERAVDALRLTLTQNEFDSLVSVVFNLGPGVLNPDRTLGKALRRGDKRRAANALLLYIKGGNPLRTLPGLVLRRRAERKLFLTAAPVVRHGTRMTARELQSALRAIGWPVKADGKIGRHTRRALRDFQRGWYGPKGKWVLKPTGYQNDRTVAALRTSLAHGGMASPHFTYREFADHQTRWIKVDRELLVGLERLRADVGPVGILSGYRDPSRNIGAKNSQHHYGNAMDPTVELPRSIVTRLGAFSGIGINPATGRVRHLDVRHVGPNPTGGTLAHPTIFDDTF